MKDDKLSEEDKSKILENFAKKITEESIDLDPKITKLINEHFWELIS